MGALLERAALSPNIRERRDSSCALFDELGQLVAQAAHIPVHLGSIGLAVRAAISGPDGPPAGAVLLNDPYAGGTHLPDLTLVLPVRRGARVLGYVACRAHHADVGGATPGSMGVARTIEDEGVRIPPTLLPARLAADDPATRALLGGMRALDERIGDLAAQRAACELGARRLLELGDRHGDDVVAARGAALRAYAARLMRAALRELPDGRWAFADALDDDGVTAQGPGALAEFGSEGVVIRVVISKLGDTVSVDFSDSSAMVAGPVNAPFAVTVAAVLYCFRLLLPRGAPTNDGLLEPIDLECPTGSVVAADYPAPVAGGNVETSQRIVDVVLGALARAIPQRIPAASAGSMSNLALGSAAGDWAYYETIPGGAGASAAGPGARALQTHMTNTRNTPIEELEHALPLRVRRYAVRAGSGGQGSRGRRGGDGVIRELELTAPATVSLLADRRRFQPYGLGGGEPGAPGEDWHAPVDGTAVRLPSKTTFAAAAGDIIRILTPGGGGWGDPRSDLGFSKAKLLAGEISKIS
ncbi:MAG: hydantoinase B/oxoprolinase family protein [Deltaproteobacteria bacterium]|nr:hydantoinase B/oxoprolinase family protein [Deltaproteobacteria bacterium]